MKNFGKLNPGLKRKATCRAFRQPIKRRKDIIIQCEREKFGYDCFLPNANGTKVRVCRDFFLATLDIKKDLFNSWIKSSGCHQDNNSEENMENVSPEGEKMEKYQ